MSLATAPLDGLSIPAPAPKASELTSRAGPDSDMPSATAAAALIAKPMRATGFRPKRSVERPEIASTATVREVPHGGDVERPPGEFPVDAPGDLVPVHFGSVVDVRQTGLDSGGQAPPTGGQQHVVA